MECIGIFTPIVLSIANNRKSTIAIAINDCRIFRSDSFIFLTR